MTETYKNIIIVNIFEGHDSLTSQSVESPQPDAPGDPSGWTCSRYNNNILTFIVKKGLEVKLPEPGVFSWSRSRTFYLRLRLTFQFWPDLSTFCYKNSKKSIAKKNIVSSKVKKVHFVNQTLFFSQPDIVLGKSFFLELFVKMSANKVFLFIVREADARAGANFEQICWSRSRQMYGRQMYGRLRFRLKNYTWLVHKIVINANYVFLKDKILQLHYWVVKRC